MSTEFAQIDMINKTIDTVVVDTVEKEESHMEFMYRRSNAMAGMIGLLSSRLEILEIELRWDMKDNHAPMYVRRNAKRMREEVLETLIKYQQEWANMQQYEEGEVGMDIHKRKMKEYTTELEALKTLAL